MKKRLKIKGRVRIAMIEGFLGETEERDEHGIIREISSYLGCPSFTSSTFNPKVKYDSRGDVAELLKENAGKLLRVTIEAIELGGGKHCAKCKDRFKCLTQKW